MWNDLCDDAHDAQTMKVINRAVVVIALSFITFGGYAISTRLGARRFYNSGAKPLLSVFSQVSLGSTKWRR